MPFRIFMPATPTTPPRHRWRTLLVLSAARTIDDTEGGVVNNLFPIIRQSLGLSLSQLGLLSTVGKVCRMVFGLFWSIVADRIGRKPVLVFVSGVWGVWTVLAGFADSFETLLLLYTIGAIGTVAGEPISNGLIADYFRGSERGRAYGAIRSLVSFGTVLFTPLLAAFAGTPEGWRYGLFCMGGLSMLSGLAIALWVEEPRRSTSEVRPRQGLDWRVLGVLWRIPSIQVLAGNVVFVTSIVMWPFMVTFYVDERGWTPSDANWLQGGFTAAWMISSLLGGLLGDWFEGRFGPRGRILLMQLYLGSFAAASFLAFQVNWGGSVGLTLSVLLLGVVGSVGFSGVVQPMVSQVSPGPYRATAFALLFSFLQGLTSAVLTYLGGWVAETWGLSAMMLWLVTLPYALNAVYWGLFYQCYERDRLKAETGPPPSEG